LLLALVANLANIAVVSYVGYVLGNSFFTTVTIENSLKILWKPRVENNGGRCADVLPVALWYKDFSPRFCCYLEEW